MTRTLAEALAVIETQKKIINNQQQRLAWYEGILSNKNLQGSTRLATIAAKRLAETAKPDEDGYYKVYLPKLADMVGVSPSAMSRGLRTLADCTDAIEHRTEPKRDEPFKDVVYIRPTDLLNHPGLIKHTKEIKRHGGARLPCPECKSFHRKRIQREECADCGYKFFENEQIIQASSDKEPLHDAMGSNEPEELPNFGNLPVEEISDPEPLHDAMGSNCEPEPLQDATYTYRHSVASSIAFDSIPQELRCKMQWACHRSKEPYDAKILHPARSKYARASSTNEKTWASYARAVSTWLTSQTWALPYDGIGFMLNGDYVLADFDHCIIDDSGITEVAAARIKAIDSYAELSLSETGVHCIGRATIPHAVKRPDCELYNKARFVVMTGNYLAGLPGTVQDCQEAINALHAELAPPKATIPTTPCVYTSCVLSDTEILEKARKAANGAKFARLWNGDASDYPPKEDGSPDYSRADAGLLYMLRFWCNGDTLTVNRLFGQSQLARRDKWNERADYRARTMSYALQAVQ